MPVDIDYVWNETHKDIIIADNSQDSQEDKEEPIVKTQQKLVRHLTSKMVSGTRLINAFIIYTMEFTL